ncbi:thiamine-phosphate kinase [Sphingomonas montana]|uniref:thiamine-phosphate kinase n=1 Tax=Sphingomonas montana TaxID=1843236 RepID=UPI00096CD598|nr:thiamine-phosphate kinase [Sphingomonas montana]
MSDEAFFIDLLKGIATDPAARGLLDDAALFVPPAGRALVLTHDMLVEGVHYLTGDPPADVAWKLVAVNLSDLAAKGARPEGVLLGYTLGPDRAWDAAFVDGLGAATRHYAVPLLGGDTVGARGPRTLAMTAIGSVMPDGAPARGGARPGDALWVTGTIGDAGLGLAIARAGGAGAAELLAAYRRPVAQVAAGLALVPWARASADVSDGVLIDAARIAAASGCAVSIAVDAVPLSGALLAAAGDTRAARLAAATAGDDYQLMLAVAPEAADGLKAAAAAIGMRISRIGVFATGSGLSLTDGGAPIAAPGRIGYQHDATQDPMFP